LGKRSFEERLMDFDRHLAVEKAAAAKRKKLAGQGSKTTQTVTGRSHDLAAAKVPDLGCSGRTAAKGAAVVKFAHRMMERGDFLGADTLLSIINDEKNVSKAWRVYRELEKNVSNMEPTSPPPNPPSKTTEDMLLKILNGVKNGQVIPETAAVYISRLFARLTERLAAHHRRDVKRVYGELINKLKK
jgi:hypothetical protein